MTDHYVFDMKFQAGPYAVEINTRAGYGGFEHIDTGAGGGLWFEDNKLTDYDGLFELPMSVITGLREVGFIVDEEFE